MTVRALWHPHTGLEHRISLPGPSSECSMIHACLKRAHTLSAMVSVKRDCRQHARSPCLMRAPGSLRPGTTPLSMHTPQRPPPSISRLPPL
eukprot:995031-Prymnesium_polylepis.1